MRPHSCPLWRSGAWRRPGLLRYLGPRGQPGLPLREHAGGVASSLHPLLGRGFPPWVGGSHPRFLRLCAEVLGGSHSPPDYLEGPGLPCRDRGRRWGARGPPGQRTAPQVRNAGGRLQPSTSSPCSFSLSHTLEGTPWGKVFRGRRRVPAAPQRRGRSRGEGAGARQRGGGVDRTLGPPPSAPPRGGGRGGRCWRPGWSRMGARGCPGRCPS